MVGQKEIVLVAWLVDDLADPKDMPLVVYSVVWKVVVMDVKRVGPMVEDLVEKKVVVMVDWLAAL